MAAARTRILLLLAILITSPLLSEEPQADTARLELKGPVSSIVEKKALFKEQNGDWMELRAATIASTQFNSAGYKTEERSFTDGYHLRRRIEYTYDEQGRLVEQKEYDSNRLSTSWSKTFTDDGFATVFLRYDSEGSLLSRMTLQFDLSGQLLARTEYDSKGNVGNQWRREHDGTGTVVRFTASWNYREMTRLDTLGRIVERRKNQGDKRQSWEYTYDGLGNAIQARVYSNQFPPADIYSITYFPNGKPREVIHAGAGGAIAAKRIYSYDAEDRIIQQTAEWYDGTGEVEYSWRYQYDARGNLVEKNYHHPATSFTCVWSYQYDERNNRTQETFRDSSDRVFSRTLSSYDRSGNKLSEESSGRGQATGYRQIYEYDSENRWIESIRFDTEGSRQSRSTRRYNSHGHLVEENQYNDDNSLRTSTRHSYIYDERGNWVEETTLFTNNAEERYDIPASKTYRSITYFD